jgi:hypothetical protein
MDISEENSDVKLQVCNIRRENYICSTCKTQNAPGTDTCSEGALYVCQQKDQATFSRCICHGCWLEPPRTHTVCHAVAESVVSAGAA